METQNPGESAKNGGLMLVLCLLLGIFGAHRFYAGKTKSALLQLITLGGAGIWTLVDLLFILFGEFTDAEGRKVNTWKGL
jgi:TM2 domain-containing membrane protein YozV